LIINYEIIVINNVKFTKSSILNKNSKENLKQLPNKEFEILRQRKWGGE